MLKVVFCHDGHHLSDFHACDFVDATFYEYEVGKCADTEVRFSTEAVLDAFVLRVMEEKFPASEIEFYYQDPTMASPVKMEFDEYRGLIIPNGIHEIGTRSEMIKQIVQLGFAKIKAKYDAEYRKDD